MVIKDRIYVIDVTIRYEDKDNLNKPYKEKINNYNETAKYI